MVDRDCYLIKDGNVWRCNCGAWQYTFTIGDGDIARRFVGGREREASIEFWQHKKDTMPTHEQDEAERRIGEYQSHMSGCTYCGNDGHCSAECPSRLAEK